MKHLKIYFLFLLLGLLSCSRVQTLNLKSHYYSERPKNIIWLQIAGFQEEHLAMSRFSKPQGVKSSSFETMSCAGKIWNYNLYGLRPSAGSGFLSQMVGSKNIKNNCEDYKKSPLWSYLNPTGYKVGIFEIAAGDDSLSASKECSGGEGFLGQSILWKMENAEGKKLFHYLGNDKFEKGNIYYDKSCKSGACFATLFDNLKSIWRRFEKEQGQSIFIVRDFSYLKALKAKNITKAREILYELDKSLQFFHDEFKRSQETLFLVTSSESINFEMPKKGKEWLEFETKGKHIIFRNTSLMSPVFAKGSGAENFCGLYEEYEIIKRIFWTTAKKTWNPLDLF
ncbi:MAG: hypothetical protein CME70_21880 [Halobacteriovorax sp.]|nr:hypothetical protein [Halobacteriovorax sp.]